MEFTIYYTTGWYTSGYDYPGEYQELADKIAERTGCETTAFIETFYRKPTPEQAARDVGPVRSYSVRIWVPDLQTLQRIQESYNHSLIISFGMFPTIEIYDDYRE